ncbi:hypothetical protein [Tomitella gaofuii]|uniref:hypothetical protein n=1 Tax=Tomitella gaofuii TaxID=2760083 RepID=UPI0015FB85EC|nr:hypothetical protein [Tomitella gaofuii]
MRGRGISIGPLRTHTTALVSGLLFIGIGVLFLLTDGTANLGGIIGVDADQRIKTIVGDVSASVSTTAVVFVQLVSARSCSGSAACGVGIRARPPANANTDIRMAAGPSPREPAAIERMRGSGETYSGCSSSGVLTPSRSMTNTRARPES